MIPFSLLAGALVLLVGAANAALPGEARSQLRHYYLMIRSAAYYLPLFARCRAGYQISCGATSNKVSGNVTWVPDGPFINTGKVAEIDTPGVMPMLSSLRYFPDASARKHCYVVPAERHARYLVRTTYYYGGFDGGGAPPAFDQVIDGTRWSAVDTAANYAGGLATYYEAVVEAAGKEVSVCVARSAATPPGRSPFISALEVVPLEGSVYGAVNFTAYALSTIARHGFGHNGSVIGDGSFPVVESQASVATEAFWNKPPEDVFRRGLTTSRGKSLDLQWPPAPLPAASYYLALYFQDNRAPSALSWRVFDVAVNGQPFFAGLNVSTAGSMVYGGEWPLSGQTTITLTPALDSPVGPVINAAELMMVVPLGGRTHPRDVIGMEALARGFLNPPSDWRGDPCLPKGKSWTGVTCNEDPLARVIAINLTNYRVGGSISDHIANLTAVSSIWLVGNNLTGPIPDMSLLHHLVSLHLEDNGLTGPLQESFGNLTKLQELSVQNNNLQGTIPRSIRNRAMVDISFKFKYTPGNNLS
ncbi:putative leucine-rich repeat receptor-like serine/threonine-protein kinase [Dichanthelium oligosanthes]|uniref:Putative leucine-rich repeat receptor-like serine/threonine-protein kinase n=1 Tax=Dichanthelium oligosanthes TaxID=888268 RepID=A0A1E5WB88_9POAL|nr:putative leucine-rich repeat receptor-like serine/threonine-protein kinase [Dichanthelium oligosanthes]